MFLLFVLAAVEIDSPPGGLTNERVVKVEGSADCAELEVVGSRLRRRVSCEGGRFSFSWVLMTGPNLVTVFSEKGADAVYLYCTAPVEDARVVLQWDDDGADLDLHVVEPSGEECWAGNRRVSSGGELALEAKRIECYALGSAPPGRYRVRGRCFRAPVGRPVEARVTLFLYEKPERSETVVLSGGGEEADLFAFEIEEERPGP